ncbi:DUF1573 domain-containing protein [Patescibacteria group bacterium]|nr:MAG: DUF1573 domain-containing protein [Patescibacteria group bacterium]
MKSKKFFIYLLVLVAILTFIFIYARPQNENLPNRNSASTETALAADRSSHDFGTISMKDGNVKTTFKVKNPTSKEITLNKLYTSCMCTEAKLIVGDKSEGPFGMLGHGFIPTFKQVLKPGDEAAIEVQFDPTAHGPAGVGAIEREIILEGSQGKLVSVTIRANVTP